MKSQQHTLFDVEPPAWEQDDASEQMVAVVAFSRGPQEPFDYLVPDRLRTQVEPGRRVRVPLGKGDRLIVGYCVCVETRSGGSRRLKPIASVVDSRPLLGPAMLRLTEWMSRHYLCPLGQVLEAVVPAGVRLQRGTREVAFLSLSAGVAARLGELKLSDKQRRIVSYLADRDKPVTAAQIAVAVQCTEAPIRALRQKGLIESTLRRVDLSTPSHAAGPPERRLELNADQRAALDAILAAIASGRHQTLLVHGVTGSGKTEVYMQAIHEVLQYGRQAIVLVPEISLTPQTEQRFRSRFGDVALLHSHLSDSERRRQWEQIADGDVPLVVGARSAVFAPTPNLGLIVLDEEHESSFKQDTSPRYHARDVALERARAENIPLVLGSATPSLESWHRAKSEVGSRKSEVGSPNSEPRPYRLVSMPRRIFDRPLPTVATIDLRVEFRSRRYRGAISRPLYAAMEAALRDGGQVILLLNRRGYSTHIQCSACGKVVLCPACDLALTHHLREEIALCHYCDYQSPAPSQCPDCQFPGIRYSGLGTQRLETEVKARFAAYSCLRMDTDTMQSPGSHARALGAFHSGDVRILLGTQMIAKGLDFPNVTLVGVINADTALHLPDFRAAERTFQLVTQVAGRTGRGPKGGRVLVQTFSPEHPAILAACRHDYARFAAHELPIRAELAYPPYSDMIRLVVRGSHERPTEEFARQLADRLRAAVQSRGIAARVLGPAPAPFRKLRGLYRFHMQAQSHEGDSLRAAVREACEGMDAVDEIQWIADVDPLDMM